MMRHSGSAKLYIDPWRPDEFGCPGCPILCQKAMDKKWRYRKLGIGPPGGVSKRVDFETPREGARNRAFNRRKSLSQNCRQNPAILRVALTRMTPQKPVSKRAAALHSLHRP